MALDLAAKKIEVEIGYDLSQPMECPECGKCCAHYDHREMREWRHLDTMQFETVLRCEVPRCKCPEHEVKVKTVRVPWANKGSGFTLLFECFAIDVLPACSSVKAASELMGLNWHQTIDKVRRQEHKALLKQKDDTLKNSKSLWLTGFENLSKEMQIRFSELQSLGLKVGRAYAIKQTFDHFWDYRYAGCARKFFKQWYSWARRSKLEPVKRVSKMIKEDLENIISYLEHRISNAATEGFNGVIQSIKANARGFRSFKNYRVAILFQCGKLDLKP